MQAASSTSFTDDEFGEIAVRRVRGSRYVRIRIGAGGKLTASLPARAPLALVRDLIERSRPALRKSFGAQTTRRSVFGHGSRIGASHSLSVMTAPRIAVRLRSPHVVLAAPAGTDVLSDDIQSRLRPYVEKALRAEAKAFLPRRLRHLADLYGFQYKKIRYSSAGTRWGSCSSNGTISLNIWLMQLPAELRDYVLIHELCHTEQMNHSPSFWLLVEAILPNHKDLRKQLKRFQPQM